MLKKNNNDGRMLTDDDQTKAQTKMLDKTDKMTYCSF